MRILIRLTALLLCLSSHALCGQAWDLVKEKNKIKVYTRKVEGKKIKELKIETSIQTSLNSVVKILDDVDAHPIWVYKCGAAHITDVISPSEFYYYITIDFPFPAVDRDMVIYYRRWQDPITKVVTTISTSAHDTQPIVEDYIRIVDFESEYKITPRDDGWVDIVYVLSSDPAGAIPTWMINMAIAKGPVKTMERMFSEIQKEKYQSADLEGIEELH